MKKVVQRKMLFDVFLLHFFSIQVSNLQELLFSVPSFNIHPFLNHLFLRNYDSLT